MRALTLHAGPRARARLRDGPLRPSDVRVVPAAAGGPKGLVLNPLDRLLFGRWLAGSEHEVHLLGASIGAWRMACATLPDADAALGELAEDYITQHYEHAPGRAPTPASVSRTFGRKLDQRLGRRAHEILASCSIPFWLDAVHDLPQAPRGAYWDGGITDYHLLLHYAAMEQGLVLYPHFQRQVVPGWLDKPLRHRHRSSSALDNVLVLSPSPAWVATLPGAKLPDRQDFKRYGDDRAGRIAVWRRALAESERLAGDFADWVGGAGGFEIEPL